jgi:acetyl esterase/lipase
MLKLLMFMAVTMMTVMSVRAAGEPLVVELWPGSPPGEKGSVGDERDMTKPDENLVGGRRVIRLGSVSRPTLTVYRPKKALDTGAAVVIAPGGGYHILAWDLEGTEVAEWLASIGVTGVVLKYRVPRRPGDPQDVPPVGPLQDAQRAVSVVRSRAAGWGIDPHRIGMLGFSAGGNLTVRTATIAERTYTPVDDVDKISSRPDFQILIYPAYLANAEGPLPWLRVTKETPPAFLAHAGDDPISVENSIHYYLALKRAGVPAELHVYPEGGHGYGMRATQDPVTSWPARCADWMKRQGWLKKG